LITDFIKNTGGAVRGWSYRNADTAALVDIGAFVGDAPGRVGLKS
jgi:hypothetical protein